MRKPIQALVLASAFAGAVLVISPLHAQEPSPGASKGTGMMEGGNMTTMMNQMTQMNQMVGMMNMMSQMNQMMETCNKMMQSSMDKDHGSNPAAPEKKG